MTLDDKIRTFHEFPQFFLFEMAICKEKPPKQQENKLSYPLDGGLLLNVTAAR